MHAETLDEVYGLLSAALGRIGERDAPQFLATLALDLIAHQADGDFARDAIVRAERLLRVDRPTDQGR